MPPRSSIPHRPTPGPSPSLPTKPPKHAPHSCWTCKSRKIGCDRTLPHCANCLRTNRACLGYGVRLAWPEDHPDGRRKGLPKPDRGQFFIELPDRRRRFVNAMVEDVEAVEKAGWGRRKCGGEKQQEEEEDANAGKMLVRRSLGRVERARTYAHFGEMNGDKNMLLTYYHDIIATLISTTQARNGFKQDLLPMALSGSDFASSALRHAMMAVAAIHKHGEEVALPMKTAAIRNISAALASGTARSDVQLAAVMMMCVYNVFDEREGQWHIHIHGARSVLRRRSWNTPLSSFLWCWFLYHDILGCFTQPRFTPESVIPFTSDIDNQVILGPLGCSFAVLECIHKVNLLRKHSPLPPPELVSRRMEIQDILTTTVQTIDPIEIAMKPKRQSQILATSEFYRLAALLYLVRAAPLPNSSSTFSTPLVTATTTISPSTAHIPISDTEYCSVLLDQALATLESLEQCTSPWPLFIVACEAADDEKRIQILEILDGMGETRQIGNLLVMRGLVEGVWNRMDLRGDGGEEVPWGVIEGDNISPWFV